MTKPSGMIYVNLKVQDELNPTPKTAIWYILGSLYADGTDKGGGEWTASFDNGTGTSAENVNANRYEEALNVAGFSYTRGTGAQRTYMNFSGIDPNFSITNIPGIKNADSEQRHAFMAGLMCGEGNKDGKILDDSGPDWEAHLQPIIDILKRDYITPLVYSQPHRIEVAPEQYYLVQKYPHVTWGRVPGGKPAWAKTYTPA